jgi:hypothetical protein
MTSTRFDKTEEVFSLVSIAPWGRGLRKRLPMGQDTGPSATAPPGVASAKTLLWMAAEPAGNGIAVLAMTSMRCAKTAPVSALAVGGLPRRRFPAFTGDRGYAEAVGPAMTPTVPSGAAVSAVDGRDSLAMAIGPRQPGAVQIRQDSRPRGGHDGSAGDEEKMQTRRAVAAGQDRRRRRFLSSVSPERDSSPMTLSTPWSPIEPAAGAVRPWSSACSGELDASLDDGGAAGLSPGLIARGAPVSLRRGVKSGPAAHRPVRWIVSDLFG